MWVLDIGVSFHTVLLPGRFPTSVAACSVSFVRFCIEMVFASFHTDLRTPLIGPAALRDGSAREFAGSALKAAPGNLLLALRFVMAMAIAVGNVLI